MDVATDLQVAELEWAAAQGAHVVRYATSARNEGSLRLGTRGGFEPLVAFQSHWWSPTGEDDDEESPSGFLPDVQAAATRRRKWLLGELAKAGLVATGEADELWQRAAGDASFIAAEHLYEPRAWAMQELTPAAFAGHHERGEVLLLERDDGWAVAIIAAEQGPAEDAGLRFALLCGNGAVALALLEATRQLADEPVSSAPRPMPRWSPTTSPPSAPRTTYSGSGRCRSSPASSTVRTRRRRVTPSA